MWKDFFKRAILHNFYQLIVIVPVMSIIMLIWWIFVENLERLYAMLALSFSIGLLIFTVLNTRLKLPHYDIWQSQDEDIKEGIYLFEFIFASVLVLWVLYNFSTFPKFSS